MNDGSASGRMKPGISHAPAARICSRPSSTKDQSRSTTSCTGAMLLSALAPLSAPTPFVGRFPSHTEGFQPMNETFEVAERQHGLMTRAQLLRLGLSDAQIQRRVSAGVLARAL